MIPNRATHHIFGIIRCIRDYLDYLTPLENNQVIFNASQMNSFSMIGALSFDGYSGVVA